MPQRLYGWQETGSGWAKTEMDFDPTSDLALADPATDPDDLPFVYVPTTKNNKKNVRLRTQENQ